MLTSMRLLLLCPALALCLGGTATAQVGHEPSRSPYRDIRQGHVITPTVGHFGGNGGDLGLGPHNGTVYGLRYDVRSNSFLQLGLWVQRGDLERQIVDPFVRLADRVQGPVQVPVTMAELSLQFNLTGGKTWNRLAPFIGMGGGVATSGSVPQDTSGYKFKNKFYFAPSAGLRIFLTERIHLRGEVRGVFWQLKYPDSFAQEPPAEPGTIENPNAVLPAGKLDEWTTSLTYHVGVGYSFTF
jgi:opacity protein-like surface antigen